MMMLLTFKVKSIELALVVTVRKPVRVGSAHTFVSQTDLPVVSPVRCRVNCLVPALDAAFASLAAVAAVQTVIEIGEKIHDLIEDTISWKTPSTAIPKNGRRWKIPRLVFRIAPKPSCWKFRGAYIRSIKITWRCRKTS